MRFDLAVNHMVATALRQNKISVRGGGQQWRPFLHVRDAARAFADLLESPNEKIQARIFNVVIKFAAITHLLCQGIK